MILMPLLLDFLSGGTEYLEKITRQVFELDQLGWKIPDPIIASYMLLGLSDRYDSLVSEIQNTPLDEWKSEWVKNRVLTYKINAPADLISKTLQEHGDTQDFTTRIEAAKANGSSCYEKILRRKPSG